MGKTTFECDIDFLAKSIETACNSLHQEGYEVISIIPSARGASDNMVTFGGPIAWSLTDAALITGRLSNDGRSIPPRMI